VKNDKGEIIAEDVVVNELPNDLDYSQISSNVFEEDINEKGEKRISVYPSKKSALVMKFDEIKEVDSNLE
jgi:hypothetical protein